MRGRPTDPASGRLAPPKIHLIPTVLTADALGNQDGWYELGNPAEGARLVALCYLIDRKISHGDTQSDFRAVGQLAAQLGYTSEQLATTLHETEQSYAADHGTTLLKQAFP